MTLAYDFPQDPFGVDSFPEQLRPYIPNRFVQNRYVPWSTCLVNSESRC